jgi:hypothetical protein
VSLLLQHSVRLMQQQLFNFSDELERRSSRMSQFPCLVYLFQKLLKRASHHPGSLDILPSPPPFSLHLTYAIKEMFVVAAASEETRSQVDEGISLLLPPLRTYFLSNPLAPQP